MKTLCALLALGFAGLAGCGTETQSTSDGSAAPEDSVFDPLTQTLDRAESVQDTVDQRAEDLRRRIEESE